MYFTKHTPIKLDSNAKLCTLIGTRG